jgi:hypothetical protein
MIKEFDHEANILKEKVKNLILDMHVSNTINVLKRDICLILIDVKNIKEFIADVKKLGEKSYINNVIEYEYVNIMPVLLNKYKTARGIKHNIKKLPQFITEECDNVGSHYNLLRETEKKVSLWAKIKQYGMKLVNIKGK